MRKNIYSVGQINSYIKNMFSQDFMLQAVSVKGEISNCKYHSSGHIYFTLKDEKGTMNAVMFAGNRKGLSFSMKEGDQVVVTGSVEVYERDGKYQLYAKEIILDGAGDLYQRYEALKKELEEMGMFAKEYKKQIPRFVKKVGVITAPTGAAVQDIRNITMRRNPYVQLILYPALVQGAGAKESLVKGIQALDAMGLDVLILGRGGGSIEDLWAFNEEIVVRTVFECHTPVISGVGHETDTTLTDYAADLRAPTPSAAAELAVCDIKQLFDEIDGKELRLKRYMQLSLERTRGRFTELGARLQRLSPENKLNSKKMYLADLENRMESRYKEVFNGKKHQLELLCGRLEGLSPLKKMSQGYGFLRDANGKSITDIHQVCLQDSIRIHISNGRLEAQVTDIEEIRRTENGRTD